ncbi:MAG: hypothetical protein GC129_00715 [Proteobacteria bacterium]|nr:hypothetical protein [Pseudomonadota bacterium]
MTTTTGNTPGKPPVNPDDEKRFSLNDIRAGMPSWLAYSSGRMNFNQKGEILLGWRTETPRAIPENGEVALATSGFNNVVPGPAMYAQVADAHALAMIGLVPPREQCTPDFRPCEYDVKAMPAPLGTSFGPLDIKRVAMSGICLMDDETAEQVKFVSHPKLKSISWESEARVRELEKESKLSFPYQVEHLYRAFEVVRALLDIGRPASDLRLDWVLQTDTRLQAIG